MSKTDKTRPWAVRATESPMRTCVPEHRHENGVCDLPEGPAADDYGFRGPGACYWAAGPVFLYGRGRGCGCAGCTGQVWRRRERRATRHAATSMCALARDAHRSGWVDEVDDHIVVRPQW